MKTLTFILALFLSTFANAQYKYNIKDAYVCSAILGATFLTLEIRGNHMTNEQRAITATTGMIFSAGYAFYKGTGLNKKIQRRIKRK